MRVSEGVVWNFGQPGTDAAVDGGWPCAEGGYREGNRGVVTAPEPVHVCVCDGDVKRFINN